MNRPVVLFVGCPDYAEFREAVEWLRERTRLTVAANIAQGLVYLQDRRESPYVIVLAQRRRGEFSNRQVAQLHQLCPLARLVGLLGSWCEGETRSGEPWPGVVRLYWHQFVARASCALRDAHGQATDWTLPRTSSASDRTLFAASQPLPLGRGLVAIRTPQWVDYDALAEACSLAGYACVWWDASPAPHACGVAAVIWDAGASLVTGGDLQDLARRLPQVPVLVLQSFPRIQDQQWAAAAGASCIVSKPFLLHDLLVPLTTLTAGGRHKVA